MSKFQEICQELEAVILDSYENGTTMEQAERLAARFLHAQLVVSAELRKADLNSRMRKSGLKAIRSAVYIDAATKTDKKPTEAALSATVDLNDIVQGEQAAFDTAEVDRDDLERYYNVFGNAHIFYRSVSKGAYGG